jgi:uncharacterized protein DUF2846
MAISLHNSSIETNNTTQRITMNMKKAVVAIAIVTTLTTSGCATVPTASQEESDKAKTFEVLTDKAGLYIFRDSFVGQALKKTVWLDGEALGETAPSTFFYKAVSAGNHTVSTESEFSENHIKLQMESGRNYYINQYIKLGVFVGGAGLEQVGEKEAQQRIVPLKMNSLKNNITTPNVIETNKTGTRKGMYSIY